MEPLQTVPHCRETTLFVLKTRQIPKWTKRSKASAKAVNSRSYAACLLWCYVAQRRSLGIRRRIGLPPVRRACVLNCLGKEEFARYLKRAARSASRQALRASPPHSSHAGYHSRSKSFPASGEKIHR